MTSLTRGVMTRWCGVQVVAPEAVSGSWMHVQRQVVAPVISRYLLAGHTSIDSAAVICRDSDSQCQRCAGAAICAMSAGDRVIHASGRGVCGFKLNAGYSMADRPDLVTFKGTHPGRDAIAQAGVSSYDVLISTGCPFIRISRCCK